MARNGCVPVMEAGCSWHRYRPAGTVVPGSGREAGTRCQQEIRLWPACGLPCLGGVQWPCPIPGRPVYRRQPQQHFSRHSQNQPADLHTVRSPDTTPRDLAPGYRRSISPGTGSAGKALGGLTHGYQVAVLHPRLFREDAGHRLDRVFEPNRKTVTRPTWNPLPHLGPAPSTCPGS